MNLLADRVQQSYVWKGHIVFQPFLFTHLPATYIYQTADDALRAFWIHNAQTS